MESRKRICKKCGLEKGLVFFTKNKNCKQGVTYECLDCKNRKQQKFRTENRDEFNAASRKLNTKYRMLYPERYKKQRKRYYEKNREKILSRTRKTFSDRNCAHCNKSFTPVAINNKYCCERCERSVNSKISYKNHYKHKKHDVINCKGCGSSFIQNGKNHTFCSVNCRARYSYGQLTNEQKKARSRSDADYTRKYKRKYAIKNRDKIKARAKEAESLNRLFLGDSYIKDRLKRQGAKKVTNDIIDLKRIHLTLKRIKNERQNEQPTNP